MADTQSQNEAAATTQQSPLASQRAKQSGDTSAAGRTRYFPLGYRAAASQWWANVPAAVAEHRVMSFIPYLKSPPTQTVTGTEKPGKESNGDAKPTSDSAALDSVTAKSSEDPHGPRRWSSNLVQLSGKNRALNEFTVERLNEVPDQNLVMLHGYGAGLGFYYKNFEGLSRQPGWKIYALDLLGMGRSSRPPFKIGAKTREEAVTEAEAWFVDAIEEWRKKRNIERFTLLGHSLGGYMAVAYALKYPGRLNKLILASPVGIPEDPYVLATREASTPKSSMMNEVLQSQDETTASNPSLASTDGNNFMNGKSKSDAAEAKAVSGGKVQAPSAPPRPYPWWLIRLWDANVSPFSVVRWTGPLGPRFVSGWTTRRFSHLPSAESEALHTYAYTLFKQKGSGEYALAYVLAPGAFARSPLIRRIDGVGRQAIPSAAATSTVTSSATSSASSTKETGYPVVLMYGENDWMDIKGGYAARDAILAKKKALLEGKSETEKSADGASAKVVIIGKAGHHLYLDGWEEFNEVMRGEMDETAKSERARKA